MYTPAPPGGGTCLSPGYAGSRSDSFEPIPMVQRSCPGPEEGWYSAFLRGLQMPQCAYEEGLVPPATDLGGPGKHGRVSAFLVDGFQVRLLADKLAQGSQQYTAFTVGNLGFYKFTCMLFGLCNALVTFQHLMQNTLGELNLTYCVIYLDDVIVFGRMEEGTPGVLAHDIQEVP